MATIAWMLLGALIGWAASLATRRESFMELAVNAATGIIGALLGSALLAPMLEVPVALHAGVNPASLQMAILGAVVLLAAVNLVHPARWLRRAGPAGNPHGSRELTRS